MTNYKDHKYKNFDDFLSEIPNNADRVSIKKILTPLIKELQSNHINLPHDFVDVMKRFNLSSPVIADYMKTFINIKIRLINHTNSFEKNTILTWQALKCPQTMMNKFKEYTSAKYPYFGNKNNLFSEIEKEIVKLHGKLVNYPEKSDKLERSNSDDYDKNEILIDADNDENLFDGLFDEDKSIFPEYDDYANDDYFYNDLINYL